MHTVTPLVISSPARRVCFGGCERIGDRWIPGRCGYSPAAWGTKYLRWACWK